jgi:hypothetical protein
MMPDWAVLLLTNPAEFHRGIRQTLDRIQRDKRNERRRKARRKKK